MRISGDGQARSLDLRLTSHFELSETPENNCSSIAPVRRSGDLMK